MKFKFLLESAFAGLFLISNLRAGSFAAAVVNYNPGAGYTAGYTNANVVLGQPSTGTPAHPLSITPFSPPSRTNQILSLGAGGSLTVSFATPIVSSVPGNPFGLDFLIFGNSFFVEGTGSVATGAVYGDACQATVSVSADGINFYELNTNLAPQLNYLYPTDGSGNFQVPVNPALNDFTNLTLAQIRALYNGSAGGAGYAIAWAQDAYSNNVNLFEIRYIRVDVQSGQALIAGFAAVSNTNQFFAEDFSRDPAADGWRYFGDTNLFRWNSASRNLQVTWDSSQPNSYFYHPLGTILGRADDFTMSFDLVLNDYAIGVNPDQPDTFELATGFFNYAEATNSEFQRGNYPTQPDLAEFDFFQYDDDPSFAATNSVNPTFVDSENDFAYNNYGIVELPTNVIMRVTLAYSAADQTGVLTVTTNGIPIVAPSYAYLNNDIYGIFADFHLDTFAVESYSDINSGSSLLAHGTIGNVLVVMPPPPVTFLQASVVAGVGRVQFASKANWNYVLQSSADLLTWQADGPLTGGTGASLTLQDTNAPQTRLFYRVNALRAD